jgi:hypothetical protein
MGRRGIVGSRYPPGNEDTIKAVEAAFRDVWDTLVTNQPSPNADPEGLRVAVIHVLLDLIEEGVTDPNDLRVLRCAIFPLSHAPKPVRFRKAVVGAICLQANMID